MKEFYNEVKIFVENNLLDKKKSINSKFLLKYSEKTNDFLSKHWASTISELYYCSYYNIIIQPKCYCGNNLKFVKFGIGYRTFCSNHCKCFSPIVIEKIKQTNLEKYGVENVSQNKDFVEKRKQTNIQRYGETTNLKTKETKDKIKQTNLDKYGTNSPLQNQEIKNKIKQTNFNKYGTNSPLQNQEIKNKIKQTNLNKYGTENVFQNQEIKNKIKQTNLVKYETENPAQNQEIKNKIKQTNLDKYGTENPAQNNITNFDNLNSEFINNNFNNNGFLNRNNIMNYFNVNKLYFNKYKKIKLKFNDLLPFKKEKQKTQNEIYNLFYNNDENKSLLNNVKKSDYQFSLNVKINDRQFIKYQNNEEKEQNLEIDILDYDNKFGIEYNGLMFHSFGISNHSMFNNDDKESIDKKKHLIKTNLCEEKQFQLFHIFENEWLNYRQKNIWISMINSKLHNHTKIFARKTIIKEIKLKDKYGNETNKNDNNLVKEFLNKNHLQGYVASSINIGLFIINKIEIKDIINEFDKETNTYINKEIIKIKELEELVSIMTFGKPRMSKSYEYELLRYASKLNTTIIGGGSKLLAYFEKHYKPKSLISYANRRWSTGNFYFKTGFQFSHISEPNYFYFLPEDLSKLTYNYSKENKINNSILYSRNQFQKHKLEKYYFEGKLSSFDNNLTETQNMYNNNYRKIYDSGNLIFFKIYN